MSDLPTPCSQLSTVEITRTDVYTALCALDETKAYGCDEIHPKVLKQCLLSLLDSVHSLFVMCLSYRLIPVEWKTHKLHQFPKKEIYYKSSTTGQSLFCAFCQRYWSQLSIARLLILSVLNYLRTNLGS